MSARSLPWLWGAAAAVVPTAWASDPGATGLVPTVWSGAALLVLLGGWRASVAVLGAAAAALVAAGAFEWFEGLLHFVCAGLLPASATAALCRVVGAGDGRAPFLRVMGIGFAGTWVACAAGGFAASLLAGGDPRVSLSDLLTARLLLAMAEATVTGALIATVLVCRPQWLRLPAGADPSPRGP